jgi:hypothetical protein
MVAAAGDTDIVSLRTIGISVALILTGLVVVAVLCGKTNLLTKTPFPRPPAALEQKAQDVIDRRIGLLIVIHERVWNPSRGILIPSIWKLEDRDALLLGEWESWQDGAGGECLIDGALG